jgi:hypothetical protein
MSIAFAIIARSANISTPCTIHMALVTGANPEGTRSLISVPDLADGGWVLNTVLLKNSAPARN